MLTQHQADQIIQQMVDTIVRKFHPDKIILFGSYARGQVTKDSDVDLLVVMPVRGSRHQKTVEIYRAIGAVGLPKDIVVFTPQEVKVYSHLVGTILKPALQEGKLLYEKKS